LLHLSLLGCYVLPTGKWSQTFHESVLPQSKDRTVFLDYYTLKMEVYIPPKGRYSVTISR